MYSYIIINHKFYIIPTLIIKTYVYFLALVSLVSNQLEFSSKKILSAVQNNNCNDSFPGLQPSL